MWFHLRYYYFDLVFIGGPGSSSVDLFSGVSDYKQETSRPMKIIFAEDVLLKTLL